MDGTLRTLWNTPGTGGHGKHATTSILPVLALHSWPEKRRKRDDDNPRWTPWTALPVRDIARLGGVLDETARGALDRLAAHGLLEQRHVHRVFQYRLSVECFARRYGRVQRVSSTDDAFFKLPRILVHGGTWATLRPGEQQLLLTIAACDPVHDEAAYRSATALSDPEDDPVASCRASVPLSLTVLQEQSGLSRAAVRRALTALGEAGLIRSGPAERGGRWYAVNWPAAPRLRL
jgi:DNA-binding transcriptional ArsR family regulator